MPWRIVAGQQRRVARVADIQNLHADAALGEVGAATDDLHAQRRRCGIAGQQHRVLRVLHIEDPETSIALGDICDSIHHLKIGGR